MGRRARGGAARRAGPSRIFWRRCRPATTIPRRVRFLHSPVILNYHFSLAAENVLGPRRSRRMPSWPGGGQERPARRPLSRPGPGRSPRCAAFRSALMPGRASGTGLPGRGRDLDGGRRGKAVVVVGAAGRDRPKTAAEAVAADVERVEIKTDRQGEGHEESHRQPAGFPQGGRGGRALRRDGRLLLPRQRRPSQDRGHAGRTGHDHLGQPDKSRVVLVRDAKAVGEGRKIDRRRRPGHAGRRGHDASSGRRIPSRPGSGSSSPTDVVGIKTNAWNYLPTGSGARAGHPAAGHGRGRPGGQDRHQGPGRAGRPDLPGGHGPDQRPPGPGPLLGRHGQLHQELHHVRAQAVRLPRRRLRRPGLDLVAAGRQGQDPAEHPVHADAAVPQHRAARLLREVPLDLRRPARRAGPGGRRRHRLPHHPGPPPAGVRRGQAARDLGPPHRAGRHPAQAGQRRSGPDRARQARLGGGDLSSDADLRVPLRAPAAASRRS